jgi:hypothetical protein
MLLGPTASADELIRVPPGFSRLLRLDRPVGTVIVGNPDIADVTIQSEKAVVLTAKKAEGNTNLIILDVDNNDLLKADVFVRALLEPGVVKIYPQVNRNALHNYYAYYCPPRGRLCDRISDPNESLTHLEQVGPSVPRTTIIQQQTPSQQQPGTTTSEPSSSGVGPQAQ